MHDEVSQSDQSENGRKLMPQWYVLFVADGIMVGNVVELEVKPVVITDGSGTDDVIIGAANVGECVVLYAVVVMDGLLVTVGAEVGDNVGSIVGERVYGLDEGIVPLVGDAAGVVAGDITGRFSVGASVGCIVGALFVVGLNEEGIKLGGAVVVDSCDGWSDGA
mmetsp:Transcript_57834/g.95938  ORF Transcript_57834/g.95938 Transcript_57834/m.95938 type:complete len:164 (-) Transcript_57834:193-684(-)